MDTIEGAPAVPIGFSQAFALLRWHEKGRPWDASDLRLDGFSTMRGTRWFDATHIPTGISLHVCGGMADKLSLIEALRQVVSVRADTVVAKDAARRN